MRIAYLTQIHPTPDHNGIVLPARMAEAMAKRGYKVLVIASSDREYTYHIYRNNITIVQLRSFKCPVFIGHQPMFLPIPTILQSLYKFRPDIIYMDASNLMNWMGHVYSFFLHVPTRSTPQTRVKTAEQN